MFTLRFEAIYNNIVPKLTPYYSTKEFNVYSVRKCPTKLIKFI